MKLLASLPDHDKLFADAMRQDQCGARLCDQLRAERCAARGEGGSRLRRRQADRRADAVRRRGRQPPGAGRGRGRRRRHQSLIARPIRRHPPHPDAVLRRRADLSGARRRGAAGGAGSERASSCAAPARAARPTAATRRCSTCGSATSGAAHRRRRGLALLRSRPAGALCVGQGPARSGKGSARCGRASKARSCWSARRRRALPIRAPRRSDRLDARRCGACAADRADSRAGFHQPSRLGERARDHRHGAAGGPGRGDAAVVRRAVLADRRRHRAGAGDRRLVVRVLAFPPAARSDLSVARRDHDVYRHRAHAARCLRQGEEVRPPGVRTISRPGIAGAAGELAARRCSSAARRARSP